MTRLDHALHPDQLHLWEAVSNISTAITGGSDAADESWASAESGRSYALTIAGQVIGRLGPAGRVLLVAWFHQFSRDWPRIRPTDEDRFILKGDDREAAILNQHGWVTGWCRVEETWPTGIISRAARSVPFSRKARRGSLVLDCRDGRSSHQKRTAHSGPLTNRASAGVSDEQIVLTVRERGP